MEESLSVVLDRIVKSTGRDEEEILKLIEAKEKEFEGLVSTLGAAYIVAKELGVKINNSKIREAKINELVSGLSGVSIKAKIIKIFPVNEFERKDGRKGRVMNVFLGDDTGTIRLSLWDSQIDDFKFNEGDVIKVEGAYVKEGYKNTSELRVRDVSLITPLDEEIMVSEEISFSGGYDFKDIINLKEGDRVELKGYVIRLFNKNPVYKYCPVCKTKLEGNYCAVHGEVEPEVLMVVSGIVDDGTSSIVFNLFRDTAESFLGRSWQEVDKEIEEKGIEAFYESLSLEMKKYKFKGVVKKSEYTNSLELYVNSFKELNLVDDINNTIKEVNE